MQCREAVGITLLHELAHVDEMMRRDAEWHMITCPACHKRQCEIKGTFRVLRKFPERNAALTVLAGLLR